MNKLLAATFLVAAAAVAAAQTVWRFEATDGDGKQGGDAVGKSANKTPKTGDTTDCRSARRHAIGFGAVPEQLVGFRICCVLPGELVFVGKKCYNLSIASIRTSVPFFGWLRI